MHFAIDTADRRPIHVQLMDEIRRAVVVRALRPDDALPSVRQLASALRVNPNSVARAYDELERAGVSYVRRNRGAFVARLRPGGGERQAVAGAVARRALLDAHRHGIRADELAGAIRHAAAARTPLPPTEQP
jgi:GntR family transcriptional regulator